MKPLRHIDNGFFRLTDKQAAAFNRCGKPPPYGLQFKSLPYQELKRMGVTLEGRNGPVEFPARSTIDTDDAGPYGWVTRTPYSCRADAPKRGWVYALSVYFPV